MYEHSQVFSLLLTILRAKRETLSAFTMFINISCYIVLSMWGQQLAMLTDLHSQHINSRDTGLMHAWTLGYLPYCHADALCMRREFVASAAWQIWRFALITTFLGERDEPNGSCFLIAYEKLHLNGTQTACLYRYRFLHPGGRCVLRIITGAKTL